MCSVDDVGRSTYTNVSITYVLVCTYVLGDLRTFFMIRCDYVRITYVVVIGGERLLASCPFVCSVDDMSRDVYVHKRTYYVCHSM